MSRGDPQMVFHQGALYAADFTPRRALYAADFTRGVLALPLFIKTTNSNPLAFV